MNEQVPSPYQSLNTDSYYNINIDERIPTFVDSSPSWNDYYNIGNTDIKTMSTDLSAVIQEYTFGRNVGANDFGVGSGMIADYDSNKLLLTGAGKLKGLKKKKPLSKSPKSSSKPLSTTLKKKKPLSKSPKSSSKPSSTTLKKKKPLPKSPKSSSKPPSTTLKKKKPLPKSPKSSSKPSSTTLKKKKPLPKSPKSSLKPSSTTLKKKKPLSKSPKSSSTILKKKKLNP